MGQFAPVPRSSDPSPGCCRFLEEKPVGSQTKLKKAAIPMCIPCHLRNTENHVSNQDSRQKFARYSAEPKWAQARPWFPLPPPRLQPDTHLLNPGNPLGEGGVFCCLQFCSLMTSDGEYSDMCCRFILLFLGIAGSNP
ncbi:hypothetical protein CapIbe_015890 [Capra ibex]